MKDLICIVCPRGCHLHIDDKLNVTGNTCKRGINYAQNELTCPKRTISSTVKIESKIINRLPVKTNNDIPKDKIFEVMNELNKVVVKTPVFVGDVIIKNVLKLGVDIVSTRTILE